jgi:hypothetical protein
MHKPLVSKQYPVGHILQPKTPYVNAACTDIRETFKRIIPMQLNHGIIVLKVQ